MTKSGRRHLRLHPGDRAAGARDSGRDIVATAKCNECHQQLGGIPGDTPESSGAGFHGGSRNETRYCVVCHTEQRKYGRTEATHRPGARCTFTQRAPTWSTAARSATCRTTSTRSTWASSWRRRTTTTAACSTTRRCSRRTCATAPSATTARRPRRRKTAQGDNWKNVPSRLACGACHDGINFATGKGVTIADALKGLTSTTASTAAHGGGAQADDSPCAPCHTPDRHRHGAPAGDAAEPENALHVARRRTRNTNAAWIASNTEPPAGGRDQGHLRHPERVAATPAKQPVMVFRMLQNGARGLQHLRAGAADPATGQGDAGTTSWARRARTSCSRCRRTASPRRRTSTATRQRLPAQHLERHGHRHRRRARSTGPDANGYYTVTLTGVDDPRQRGDADRRPRLLVQRDEHAAADADQPGTDAIADPCDRSDRRTRPTCRSAQPNMIGGLIVIAPNVAEGGDRLHRPPRRSSRTRAATSATRSSARSPTDAFHGGQRNDGTTCSWCHTPEPAPAAAGRRTRPASSTRSTRGAKRSVPFTWHASSTTRIVRRRQVPGRARRTARPATCRAPTTSARGVDERAAEPAVPHGAPASTAAPAR